MSDQQPCGWTYEISMFVGQNGQISVVSYDSTQYKNESHSWTLEIAI